MPAADLLLTNVTTTEYGVNEPRYRGRGHDGVECEHLDSVMPTDWKLWVRRGPPLHAICELKQNRGGIARLPGSLPQLVDRQAGTREGFYLRTCEGRRVAFEQCPGSVNCRPRPLSTEDDKRPEFSGSQRCQFSGRPSCGSFLGTGMSSRLPDATLIRPRRQGGRPLPC